jgi:Mg2+ and Co2+ transporter CorA
MDKQEMLRRGAEANRLLVEGRRTIERQRNIIARLERIGIDSAKQHALLTILVKEHAAREERFGQLLHWLESQPDQQTGRRQNQIEAMIERTKTLRTQLPSEAS